MMDEEKMYELRGILTQIQQMENDCIAMGFDRRINATRKSDLIRRLDHVRERVQSL